MGLSAGTWATVFGIGFAALAAHGTAARGATAELHARFIRHATLPSWELPFCTNFGSPWSPSGDLLAVTNGEVLAVFDARRPTDPPRPLLRIPTPGRFVIAWSPDGDWLACETSAPSPHVGPHGIAMTHALWAVPVTDDGPSREPAVGRPEVLDWNARLASFLWAADGYLYVWDDRRVRRVAPPSAWRSAHPDSAVRASRLAFVPGQGIVAFAPGPSPRTRLIDGLRDVMTREAFPHGRRYLITRLAAGPSRNVVLDPAGEPLGDLDAFERSLGGPPAFTATSVTADGRYVAGSYDTPRRTDGTPTDGAPADHAGCVFLTDTLGNARIPVSGAGRGVEPRCSPRGNDAVLSFPGGLEVGSLVVRR